MSTKINQFVSVTGATVDTARKLLNACAGNLELAIGMYMEDGAPSTATDANSVDRLPVPIPLVIIIDCFVVEKNIILRFHRDEDEVRPPIPPIRAVLVENDPPTGTLLQVTSNFYIGPFVRTLSEEKEELTIVNI